MRGQSRGFGTPVEAASRLALAAQAVDSPELARAPGTRVGVGTDKLASATEFDVKVDGGHPCLRR